MKRAICVGINNYPGSANDLQGCLNDVSDWSNLLHQNGFETTIITNSAATRAKVKSVLNSIITAAQGGDVLVFQYSGHGTSVIDRNGDETDSYDEALYLYDGALLDDELRDIFKLIPQGVQMIIILDSCFSGTATKASVGSTVKRKYVPGDGQLAKKKKAFLYDEAMKEILIAGCGDDEYSYDTDFTGRANGAFSRYAIDVFKAGLTYAAFIDTLNKKLPSSDYPQTPQLECSIANAKQIMFSSLPEIPEIPEIPANEFRFEFHNKNSIGEVNLINNKWTATLNNIKSTSKVSAIAAIAAVIKRQIL